MEQWLSIREFPTYAVSNHGRIRNEDTDRIMAVYENQRGIIYVGMMRDGVQHKRSLDLLVAEAFLGPPPRPTFESLIHLNGDITNSRADNLMWRPTWFRIQYHAQFNRRDLPRVLVPVYVVDTDEVFRNSRELAIRYGVLEKDVALACNNYENVWPVDYQVRVYKE